MCPPYSDEGLFAFSTDTYLKREKTIFKSLLLHLPHSALCLPKGNEHMAGACQRLALAGNQSHHKQQGHFISLGGGEGGEGEGW